MIDVNEELRKNHERVDIISGNDNLEEITYDDVRNLKPKKFNSKVLKGIIISSALVLTAGASAYVGNKIDFNKGKETTNVVSNLDEEDVVYNIDTAPDIVVIKYLNYVIGKNDTLKPDCEEALDLYSSFESDTQSRPTSKEDNENYKKFRNKAKIISGREPFGEFRYSIAVDENDNIIKDNKQPILIDNQNCMVYMPAKESIDTNNLPEGSFVQGDTLYIPYNNESSIYKSK